MPHSVPAYLDPENRNWPLLAYRKLFSEDPMEFEAAARALVVRASDYRDQFDPADEKIGGDKAVLEKIGTALSQMLLESGDRYYSYLTYSEPNQTDSGDLNVEATIRASRALKHRLGSKSIVLPPLPNESELNISVKAFSEDGRINIGDIKSVDTSKYDEGDLMIATIPLTFPKTDAPEDENRLTVVAQPLLVQTYVLLRSTFALKL